MLEGQNANFIAGNQCVCALLSFAIHNVFFDGNSVMRLRGLTNWYFSLPLIHAATISSPTCSM